MINDWDESSCADGWLHRFHIIETNPDGTMEMCKLCTKVVFFPTNCDNLTYLSYHLREALQTDHPLYFHEWPGGAKYRPKKTSY
jgi:hypothetical protein